MIREAIKNINEGDFTIKDSTGKEVEVPKLEKLKDGIKEDIVEYFERGTYAKKERLRLSNLVKL